MFSLVLLGLWVIPAAAQQGATIDVTRASGNNPFAYEPADVTIQPGDSITWTNPRLHTTGSAEDHPTNCRQGNSTGTCPWASEPMPPGGSFTVTFPAEGSFNYFCAVHPYMEGRITVGDGDPSEPEPTDEPSSEPPAPSPTPSASPTADPTPDPSDEPSASDPEDEPSDDESTAEPTEVDSSTEESSAASEQPDDDPTSAEQTPEDRSPTEDESDDRVTTAARGESLDAGGIMLRVVAALLIGLAAWRLAVVWREPS